MCLDKKKDVNPRKCHTFHADLTLIRVTAFAELALKQFDTKQQKK